MNERLGIRSRAYVMSDFAHCNSPRAPKGQLATGTTRSCHVIRFLQDARERSSGVTGPAAETSASGGGMVRNRYCPLTSTVSRS